MVFSLIIIKFLLNHKNFSLLKIFDLFSSLRIFFISLDILISLFSLFFTYTLNEPPWVIIFSILYIDNLNFLKSLIKACIVRYE